MKKMRKTILKKVLLLFITINTLTSCVKAGKYKNFEGFKLYLQEIGIDYKKKNQLYYIVRIEDCFSCSTTEINLKMLSKIEDKENLQIIIVGKTVRESYLKLIKILGNKNQIFFDENSEIFNFETGFSKPLLIHLKSEKKVTFFKEITDEKIDLAEAYINYSDN